MVFLERNAERVVFSMSDTTINTLKKNDCAFKFRLESCNNCKNSSITGFLSLEFNPEIVILPNIPINANAKRSKIFNKTCMNSNKNSLNLSFIGSNPKH